MSKKIIGIIATLLIIISLFIGVYNQILAYTPNIHFDETIEAGTEKLVTSLPDVDLSAMDIYSMTVIPYDTGLSDVVGYSQIETDTAGNLWYQAEDGLVCYNGNSFDYYNGRTIDSVSNIVEQNISLSEDDIKKWNTIFDDFYDITDIAVDFQGHIWVSSSSCGIGVLTDSKFRNLFDVYSLRDRVVNSVLLSENMYFIGTDEGLYIINKDNDKAVTNSITSSLANRKVTVCYKDANNNLWFGTNSGTGLLEYTAGKNFITFNGEAGLPSNNITAVTELYDKTVVAACYGGGISFMKDDQYITSLTTANSTLGSNKILCLAKSAEGDLYLGTEDSGIYIVKNKKVSGHINVDGRVEKLVAYMNGFFAVTDKGISFIRDGEVTTFNNVDIQDAVDILILSKHAYVIAQSGLYVFPASELMDDDISNMEHYGRESGFTTTVVEGSGNILDHEELVICVENGMLSFKITDEDEQEDQETTDDVVYPLYGLEAIYTDDEELELTDGRFLVPEKVGEISVSMYEVDYADCNVHYDIYIETVTDVVHTDDLENTVISTSLKPGLYRLWIEQKDSEENVISRVSYLVEKEQFELFTKVRNKLGR